MRQGAEVLIVDIQEILVNRVNHLRFDNSPNPYNPKDYSIMDKAMKRLAKLDTRLSKLKVQLLIQQDGVCPRCGEVINLDVEAVERDHIIPKAEGGEDTKKNTVLLHKTCHQQKTA
jgi:5-methylcytosine-specific restriction endonuclease McrA